MKKLILLFLLSAISLQCRSNDDADTHLNIDRVMYLYVKDASGQNLIGTPNYSNESIKVSYIEPASQPYENNFEIIADQNGNKFLKLFMNSGDKNSLSAKTLIKWNDAEQDTLTAEFSKGVNYVILDKVYLGTEVICPDRAHMTGTVIK